MFHTPIGRILSGNPNLAKKAARAWERQPIDWDRMDEAKPLDLCRPQTTIARTISLSAPGTFFGKQKRTLTLCPTSREGWWLERTDLPNSLPVKCSIRNVWTTGNVVSNIVLRSGSPHNYIRMAEHIIALRMGLGIDRLLIRMDSGDPPLFNHGAQNLVEALQTAGTTPQPLFPRYVTVRERVTVLNPRGGFLTLAPPENPAQPLLAIDAALDFHTAIGRQRLRFPVTPDIFAYGASARTNTSAAKMFWCATIGWLFADIRNLGYSRENLLIAGRWHYYNAPTHLHQGKSLEAAWHRATLDLLAAIALIDDGLFVGEIISYKSGHALDTEMIQHLYRQNLLTPLRP